MFSCRHSAARERRRRGARRVGRRYIALFILLDGLLSAKLRAELLWPFSATARSATAADAAAAVPMPFWMRCSCCARTDRETGRRPHAASLLFCRRRTRKKYSNDVTYGAVWRRCKIRSDNVELFFLSVEFWTTSCCRSVLSVSWILLQHRRPIDASLRAVCDGDPSEVMNREATWNVTGTDGNRTFSVVLLRDIHVIYSN